MTECDCNDCRDYEPGQHLGIDACPHLKTRTLLQRLTAELQATRAVVAELRRTVRDQRRWKMGWRKRKVQKIETDNELYLLALDSAEICTTIAHWNLIQRLVARCIDLEDQLADSEAKREWLGEELEHVLRELGDQHREDGEW
jgi:hypothetical protein